MINYAEGFLFRCGYRVLGYHKSLKTDTHHITPKVYEVLL